MKKKWIRWCPFNCSKYQAASESIKHLSAERKASGEKNQAAQIIIENLNLLSSQGHQILGIEQNYVVIMKNAGKSTWTCAREVHLYQLPIYDHQHWLCCLYMDLKPNCHVYIKDWSSTVPDQGYGSTLMKHLLNFLRSAGFRYVSGIISPADFDHEEKLRHFYTKFGFKITDHKDFRSLHLDLFDEQIPLLEHEGYTVCCRSDSYQRLRSEELLKVNGEGKTYPCAIPRIVLE